MAEILHGAKFLLHRDRVIGISLFDSLKALCYKYWRSHNKNIYYKSNFKKWQCFIMKQKCYAYNRLVTPSSTLNYRWTMSNATVYKQRKYLLLYLDVLSLIEFKTQIHLTDVSSLGEALKLKTTTQQICRTTKHYAKWNVSCQFGILIIRLLYK